MSRPCLVQTHVLILQPLSDYLCCVMVNFQWALLFELQWALLFAEAVATQGQDDAIPLPQVTPISLSFFFVCQLVQVCAYVCEGVSVSVCVYVRASVCCGVFVESSGAESLMQIYFSACRWKEER